MDAPQKVRPALLNPETLRRLFRLLEVTDVGELEVVYGDSRIYVRREPGTSSAESSSGLMKSRVAEDVLPIRAPLTGVYYPRSAPDQPLFVTPGAMVEPGQVVALIETMKLFNEVTADLAGEVVSLSVQQGDLVEAGQPLMHIRPREDGERV
jgi:biotin carboxyl carrier protein